MTYEICPCCGKPKKPKDAVSGRWPSNVLHDGSAEVLAGFPVTGQASWRKPQPDKEYPDAIFPKPAMDRGERGHNDTGSAARFFMACPPDDVELLFCRAKAIIEAWKLDLVNTVESCSCQLNQPVDSVLSGVATLAHLAGIRLSGLTEPFMSATPSGLKTLCESVIVAMLSLEKRHSPAQSLDVPIPNGCLVKIAATQKQTGITSITIDLPTSSGFAEPVTFAITRESGAVGEAASVSRFRYCAKASRAERNAGLEGMEAREAYTHNITGRDASKPTNALGGGERKRVERGKPGIRPAANHHPCVKPQSLMRYLCRLTKTPTGGVVLDPFAGSGSTGCAAVMEGRRFIGIELSDEYAEIARARIAHAEKQAPVAEQGSLL